MRNTKGFKGFEKRKLKDLLLEKTGCRIKSNCLLLQAFTRSSYSAQHGGEDNEILEFIGDSVLNYYVVKIIAEKYGAFNKEIEYTFRIHQNRFSDLKKELVNNKRLAEIIDDWAVAEYLIVGKSDFNNHVDEQEKVKADLFEAILGAIAVACDYDSEVLENVVKKMLSLDEYLKEFNEKDYRPPQFNLDNAVNTLKEMAEHKECSVPHYDIATPEYLGYDKDDNGLWACACSVQSMGVTRQVWASSKRMAKKCAAYLVLCYYFNLRNEYGINKQLGNWTYKDGKLNPMG